MTIRVQGLNTLLAELARAGASVEDLRGAMGAISQLGEQVAESLAPVRMGRLRASVRGSKSRNRASVAAGNRTTVPYARVVNYGRDGKSGNRFMQRTSDVVEPQAERTLERELRQIAERLAS